MNVNDGAQTQIRTAPGAKILFTVDGTDIRSADGGKRLLFVDDADIRPAPGGKRLLMVEDGDVRAEPGGVRLAVWEGPELRRTPGGEILLVIDGSDVRVEAGGKRLLFLDGDQLGIAQLTAVLHHWKPELFKLSKAERDAASEAIAEGEAWTLAQTAPDTEAGNYMQLNGEGPLREAGGVRFKWSETHYAIKFEKNGFTGVGLKVEASGYHLIGATGTGRYVTGIFRHEKGAWNGGWFAKPGAKPQADSWKAAAEAKDGQFASKQGKLDFETIDKQLNYAGALSVVSSDEGVSGYAYRGGFEGVGYYLVVVLGGEQAAVFDFIAHNGTPAGDYYGGADASGSLTITRMPE